MVYYMHTMYAQSTTNFPILLPPSMPAELCSVLMTGRVQVDQQKLQLLPSIIYCLERKRGRGGGGEGRERGRKYQVHVYT